MSWVALRMLTGDTTKYLGIVFGVAFASLLMGQQMAIFCGLMRNTTSQVRDIEGGDVWVMDPNVQFVDDVKPMTEGKLQLVRGVPGVEWAVRLYKGIGRARLEDGNFQQMILIGVDDASLTGVPRPDRVLVGSVFRSSSARSMTATSRGSAFAIVSLFLALRCMRASSPATPSEL